MMDRIEIKQSLKDRISTLVSEPVAYEIATWYLDLGPKRMVTILKELMDEERAISQSEVGEHERKMFEIKAAKCELEKVVGE